VRAPDAAIPHDALVALSTYVLESGSLDELLLRVCTLTVDVIDGADEASVSLITDGNPVTFGATSSLPAAVDERQYETGSGPCLDAARGNQPVIVADVREDERWPEVLKAMTAEGVLSSMSVPLPIQGRSIGALNVYARWANAFDKASIAVGEQFASFAAVAVANAVSYTNASEAAAHMQAAMASRAIIEQAKGVLIARLGCDADRAFQLLVQQSQHENRKLREVAVETVARASRARG
jgi:GAF domain-containing protein